MPQHDFSGHALGKRPASTKVALMIRDFLTGIVPATPTAADHFAQVPTWNLGANDAHGTCGPTGVSNLLLLVTTYLSGHGVVVSDEDIFDLYRRSGNPGFDPDLAEDDPAQQDNGVVLQDMLSELLQHGIGTNPDTGKPYTPLAYAKIAPGDMDTLDTAIAIFGGILLGLDLQSVQQTQEVWDYAAASEWGGHCTMAGRYTNLSGTSEDRTAVITWAEVVDTTHAFIAHQEDEAWVVIWPEHLGSTAFLEGVDVEALASAYQDLTGRRFPSPEPVQPGPAPDPAPQPVAPAPTDVDQALAAVAPRLLRNKTLPRYARAPLRDWLDQWQQ